MEKVNRQVLQNALAIVKPGLANKEQLEQTTSFAFLKKRVITYNDEVSISHPVSGVDFEGAIKAEELYNLLSKLTQDEVEISCDGTEVLIKSGRVKAGLKLEKEISLPLKEELGKIEKWKKIKEPEVFIKHLNFAMLTCSHDMSQPKLTCVCVRKNGFVQGSDGFRIVQCKGGKSPIGEYLLTTTTVSEVIKLAPLWIAKNDNWVHFKNTDNTIISCRTTNTSYVDQKKIDKLLAINGGDTLQFPKTIDSIVDRVRQLAKRDFVFDENVDISIDKGKIVLNAIAHDTKSWIKESAAIKYKGKLEFSITPLLLRGILKETRICMLSEDCRFVKFTSKEGDWDYVIMLRGNH